MIFKKSNLNVYQSLLSIDFIGVRKVFYMLNHQWVKKQKKQQKKQTIIIFYIKQ